MSAASNITIASKYFRTNDGVRMRYLEAGAGKPLVLVHGFSQTAEQFKFQIEGLADRYRVIALDLRGHGESEKPNFGLKIHRLAKDLREALIAAKADEVTLLGHSMGCSVIWAYWELFGADRLSKIVLTDESPMLTSNPGWTSEDVEAAGSVLTPASLWETANARVGADGEAAVRAFIEHSVTRNCPADVKEWIIQCNLRMAPKDAATLFLNHGCQDWRDTIPGITLPTLVVGGRASLIPWKSIAWIAKQIPGAQLEIFEENEGGSHSCSWKTRPSSIGSCQHLWLEAGSVVVEATLTVFILSERAAAACLTSIH
jgi:non-heme chloroperoxidase